MARTGRPPKPTQLKVLEGNPGKRRLPATEPQPSTGVSSRPSWLLPEAKREWMRIVPELERLGLLTRVDRAALAAYCQCWARYVEAEADISENGLTFITDKGYEGPRPAVGMAVKMLEKMSLYAGKFGLSPADRVKLATPESKEDDLDARLG